MPRPQFSIRTLLWLTLVVAAFLGGIAFEGKRRDAIPVEVKMRRQKMPDGTVFETYYPVQGGKVLAPR